MCNKLHIVKRTSWERVSVGRESQLGERPSWERAPVGKKSQFGKSPRGENTKSRFLLGSRRQNLDFFLVHAAKISIFAYFTPAKSRCLLGSRRQNLDCCLNHFVRI